MKNKRRKKHRNDFLSFIKSIKFLIIIFACVFGILGGATVYPSVAGHAQDDITEPSINKSSSDEGNIYFKYNGKFVLGVNNFLDETCLTIVGNVKIISCTADTEAIETSVTPFKIMAISAGSGKVRVSAVTGNSTEIITATVTVTSEESPTNNDDTNGDNETGANNADGDESADTEIKDDNEDTDTDPDTEDRDENENTDTEIKDDDGGDNTGIVDEDGNDDNDDNNTNTTVENDDDTTNEVTDDPADNSDDTDDGDDSESITDDENTTNDDNNNNNSSTDGDSINDDNSDNEDETPVIQYVLDYFRDEQDPNLWYFYIDPVIDFGLSKECEKTCINATVWTSGTMAYVTIISKNEYFYIHFIAETLTGDIIAEKIIHS